MPTCGRPENDSVEGFVKLNRVPLSVEQITDLWGGVLSFLSQGNSERAQTTRGAPSSYKPTEDVRESLADGSLAVWRYYPPVDIDNDGKPDDDLIVWKGGLSMGFCGRRVGAADWVSTHQTYIFSVDWPQMKLNEPRTRELTEHPVGGVPKIKKGKFIGGFYDGFRPIGNEMGIFAYQGQYYFDSFFDNWGDFEGKRIGDMDDRKVHVKNYLMDILGVFHRKDGVTKQVCEFRWNEFEQHYK
jgi:hypothetical protein